MGSVVHVIAANDVEAECDLRDAGGAREDSLETVGEHEVCGLIETSQLTDNHTPVSRQDIDALCKNRENKLLHLLTNTIDLRYMKT